MDLNTQSDKLIPQFDTTKNLALKKYLPISDMERDWGFIIRDIGHTVIPSDSDYPSKGHPGSHMFSWDKGRVLNEYQFVLITEGSGIFESKRSGEKKINAGDGMHEHPTQALLDALTIEDYKGDIKGHKIALIGDIFHSRVARSNVLLWTKMGADVWISGPPTLIPVDFHQYGVNVTYNMREALDGADVVMMLRTQLERQKEVFYPSVREYFSLYGLDQKKLSLAKDDVIVMHPGPINRGVELDPAIADGKDSVILEQVTNGVAVRMAVLYLIMGAGEEETK